MITVRRSPRLMPLLLVALAGCATTASVPYLPSTLGEKDGLLVARFYVLGLQAIENASADFGGFVKEGALRDGYLAVPMMAGEYTLKTIRGQGHLLTRDFIELERPVRPARGGGVPHYIYIPGSRTSISYTTLDVNRSFRIEPGKVTNLGLLVYLPANGSNRQFHVLALDNGAEAGRFLETNYPEILGSLKDRQITLAPGSYLPADKLPDLRRAIAYHESRGPHVVLSPARAVIYGRAGTIVSLTQGPTEKSPNVQVLDTGTLSDVVGGVRQGDGYRFATSDGEVLSWDGVKLAKEKLPHAVQPAALGSLGPEGLVVIDNHLRVLTSARPGEPWAEYEGLKLWNARSDLSIASDDQGAFISVGNRGEPEKVYQVEPGGSPPKPLAAPNAVRPVLQGTYFMVARPAGLFVVYPSDNRFLFRSRASGSWELHTMPTGICKDLEVDDAGEEMSVTCAGLPYRSSDSGATWSRPET